MIKREDVFAWHNAQDAKKYLEKEGYFANVYDPDPKKWFKGILITVSPCDSVISQFEADDPTFTFGLFVPKEKML